MFVKGVIKEMFITRKNGVVKFTESDDGRTRVFTLMKCVINTLTLVIPELSNGKKSSQSQMPG